MARGNNAQVFNLTGSTTSQQALGSNPDRKIAIFYNNSTQPVYLLYGPTTVAATTTIFTTIVQPSGYYVLENNYTGPVQIIQGTANGTINVTEVT